MRTTEVAPAIADHRERAGRVKTAQRRACEGSLDTEVDEDAEAAWATDIDRRVAELDSGLVKTIPWAEMRRRLAERCPLPTRV